MKNISFSSLYFSTKVWRKRTKATVLKKKKRFIICLLYATTRRFYTKIFIFKDSVYLRKKKASLIDYKIHNFIVLYRIELNNTKNIRVCVKLSRTPLTISITHRRPLLVILYTEIVLVLLYIYSNPKTLLFKHK